MAARRPEKARIHNGGVRGLQPPSPGMVANLVPRFRSSQGFAATSGANFGI